MLTHGSSVRLGMQIKWCICRCGAVSADEAAAAVASDGDNSSDTSVDVAGGFMPSPTNLACGSRGGVVMSNMMSLLCAGRGELGGVAM